MTNKITALAVCLGCMVVFSANGKAADPMVVFGSPETKTAFFQPRPGGVLDVITSPFRALTAPVSYNRSYRPATYQPWYGGQSTYGRTNCVNGNCTTTSGYPSSCVNGRCGVGNTYGSQNCVGGNCGVNRYQSPSQSYTGYRGYNGYNTRQYPAYQPVSQPAKPYYRPVSQPVSRPYTPGPSGFSGNDPFFP